MKSDMMKPAILIIDVQSGLFDTTPPPADATDILQRINQLTDAGRQHQVPVFWIQHEDADELRYQSPEWQLQGSLKQVPGDHYIRKTTPDSFQGTDLGSTLQHLGVNTLIIGGYACEFCVDTTVRRSAGQGYPVILVSDTHTTHDKPHLNGRSIREHHNATLSNISSFGVSIEAMPLADVIQRLAK